MGGKVLAAGSGYSYDPKTGEIEIKNVTAEVSIKASGAEIFQVKEQTENIEIKTSGETVKEGEPFKCELAPATGYKFPYVIKVMMGGRLLKQKNLLRAAGSEYYTYDNTTGIIEIENVDGEIVIEAKGVQEGFFEVIPNLVNLTSDPASFEPLAKDSKVELTLKAASGYTLPTSIIVKMGENTLASTDYTYNSGTGAFALEKITATLVITAAGNRIPDPEPEPEPNPDHLHGDIAGCRGRYLDCGVFHECRIRQEFCVHTDFEGRLQCASTDSESEWLSTWSGIKRPLCD